MRLDTRKAPIGHLLAPFADRMDLNRAVGQIDSDLVDLLYILLLDAP